jgi:hypothetical protein
MAKHKTYIFTHFGYSTNSFLLLQIHVENIEKNKMSGECGTVEGGERRVKGFGVKT